MNVTESLYDLERNEMNLRDIVESKTWCFRTQKPRRLMTKSFVFINIIQRFFFNKFRSAWQTLNHQSRTAHKSDAGYHVKRGIAIVRSSKHTSRTYYYGVFDFQISSNLLPNKNHFFFIRKGCYIKNHYYIYKSDEITFFFVDSHHCCNATEQLSYFVMVKLVWRPWITHGC